MDKILTEAFDKLKAIEESEDPFCIGELSENEDDVEEVIEEGSVQSGEDLMDGIQEFEEIQSELFDVIERLTDALRAYSPDDYKYWSAYGLAQLKIIAGSDEYMSNDQSINQIIEKLKDTAQGADDSYDDDEFGDKAHAEQGVEEALSPEMEKRKQDDQAKVAQNREQPRKRTRVKRRGTGGFDRSMTQR